MNVSPVANYTFILKGDLSMYQIGDCFLYGREGVCTITDIVTRKIKGEEKKYYVLVPQDHHITIFIPVDNKQAVLKMRQVLSKEAIYKLIKAMPDNETIWIEDKNVRKQKYNNIIVNGNHEQLVKLIKILYLQREKQLKLGKNFHVQDQQFFDACEKILYDEFSTILNIELDQVVPFIINTINNSEESKNV